MGVDRGILITSDKRHDSIETAQALKSAIEGMQTMFRIGALFDFPVATNVVRVDIEADRAVVDSALSGGIVNTYELSLPCVLGAGRGLNTPRYPTFPDVVKSKKKPIKKIMFKELNINVSLAGMNIVELEPLLQSREPKEITGDAGEIAETIIRILKDGAKVI